MRIAQSRTSNPSTHYLDRNIRRCTMGVAQQAFSEATHQVDRLMGQFQNAAPSQLGRNLTT